MTEQIFEVIVWFRYAVAGEQEKDFNIHYIMAENIQGAINKAPDLYKYHSEIPFKYLHDYKEYKPEIN